MTTMMTSARLPMATVTARRGGAYPGRWRGRLAGIPEPRPIGYDADGTEYVVLDPGATSTVVARMMSDSVGGRQDDVAIVEDTTLAPGQNVLVPVTMPGIPDVYVIVRAQSKMRVWGMVAGGFAIGWAGGYFTWRALGKRGYGGGVGYTPVYGPPKKRTKRGKW